MATGFSVVTYAICKRYTQNEIAKVISSFSEGMTFKGTIATREDLPSSAKNGDLYIIKDEKCKAVYYNGEWAIFDEIPTKVSQLTNDAEYITAAALTGLATKAELEAYKVDINNQLEVINETISTLATKDALSVVENKIPTKTSQLTNDSGFLTEHQSLAAYRKASDQDVIDASKQDKLTAGENITISGNVISAKDTIYDDTAIKKLISDEASRAEEAEADLQSSKQNVLTAGKNISIVGDIISATGGDSTMGRTFVTKVAVGNLPLGSQINETDTVANILYKILYGETGASVNLYYGASDEVPTSNAGLTVIGDCDVDVLLQNGKLITIKTGNVETEEGQYPVFACDKGARLVSLSEWKDETGTFPIDFVSVDKGTYNLYYINTKTYDEDLGGTKYKFVFAEGAE